MLLSEKLPWDKGKGAPQRREFQSKKTQGYKATVWLIMGTVDALTDCTTNLLKQ
jgi:hypothetical protein